MIERLLDSDVTFVAEKEVGNVKFSEPLLEKHTADLTAALLDTRDQIALPFSKAALLSLLQKIPDRFLR